MNRMFRLEHGVWQSNASALWAAATDLTDWICRPEIKFSGLPALISRINLDKGLAKSQLDLPMYSKDLMSLFL